MLDFVLLYFFIVVDIYIFLRLGVLFLSMVKEDLRSHIYIIDEIYIILKSLVGVLVS